MLRAAVLALASSFAWAAYCADTDGTTRKKASTERPASLRVPEKKSEAVKQPRLPVAPETRRERHERPATQRQAREEKKPERASLSPQNRVTTTAPVETESRPARRERRERTKKDESASLSSAAPGTASNALSDLRERRRREERTDRAKLAAPAVPVREQPPVLKSQPRLPVAAEPAKPPTQVTCSASPRCPEPGHACQDVSFTYGGGGQNVISAGRQDVLRICRQSNSLDACCAQHCASSLHCTAR